MNVVDACVTKTSDVTHTKVEWIGQVLSHKSRRARRFGAESTKIEMEAKNSRSWSDKTLTTAADRAKSQEVKNI